MLWLSRTGWSTAVTQLRDVARASQRAHVGAVEPDAWRGGDVLSNDLFVSRGDLIEISMVPRAFTIWFVAGLSHIKPRPTIFPRNGVGEQCW